MRPPSATLRSRSSTSAPDSASRLPVGSSASRTVGLADQRPGQREALLLAAGERLREPAGHLAEAEPLDQLAAAALGRGAAAVQARREQDVLLAGQLGDQVEELEDEADVRAAEAREAALALAVHANARDLDLAGVRAVEAAEQVQQRGLAGARAPEHRHELPGLDLDVDPVEHAPGRATARRRS